MDLQHRIFGDFLIQWWRMHAKSEGLKYSAPNINVYVLMLFTAFYSKSRGVLALPASLFRLLCNSVLNLDKAAGVSE